MIHTGLGHLVAVGAIAAALCGCSKQTTTALQREWTANAEYAGDVWAATLSKTSGFPFRVQEGSEMQDPVKQVRTGMAFFGVASADRILQENEGGANLVIIASACYKSPVVFLAKPESNIKSPVDFVGRRIGIQSGTNTELLFHALLAKVNLKASDMKVVESGWGISNFETGALDVLAAFDYDEPVQLQLKGIPFVLIRPEDFDARFVGTVYFTTRNNILNRPEVVQAFMNDLVDGWKAALNEPEKAVNQLELYFPGKINVKKELLSLRRGKEYFSGENGRLLFTTQGRWREMGDSLIAMGRLQAFSFSEAIDYRFLESALARGAPSAD